MNLIVKAQVENKDGRMFAIASTAVEDRHGEVVQVEGWELKNFKANPVMLWAHDHSEIAIGVAKGIKVDGIGKKARLVFEPEFHEETEKARAIKRLFEKGILNSFSVGFRPLEAEGNQYIKQELLEVSAVNVPANPEARMMATKALEGFDKEVIESVIDKSNTGQEDEVEELKKKVSELESEVKVLRGQASYKAQQRAKHLKALDRIAEKMLRDNKREIHNGSN